MQTIDTRGQLCPAPLIATKRAIKSAAGGDSFTVITDNDTARQNLLSFLSEMGLTTSCVQTQSGDYHIAFSTNGSTAEPPAVEEFCSATPTTGKYAVAIKAETMGQGDDTLGSLLIRSCVNSLAELDSLPSHVVMYNGGVKLAMRGTDTAKSLETLAGRGVTVIVCGACVDFFGIKAELTSCAIVSNMYKINEVLTSATSVIYP